MWSRDTETLHICPAAQLIPDSVSTSSWRPVHRLSQSVDPVPHHAYSIECFMKVLSRNNQFNLCPYLNRLFILGWSSSAHKLFFSCSTFMKFRSLRSQGGTVFYHLLLRNFIKSTECSMPCSIALWEVSGGGDFYLLSTQIYPSWSGDLNRWPSGHKPH